MRRIDELCMVRAEGRAELLAGGSRRSTIVNEGQVVVRPDNVQVRGNRDLGSCGSVRLLSGAF